MMKSIVTRIKKINKLLVQIHKTQNNSSQGKKLSKNFATQKVKQIIKYLKLTQITRFKTNKNKSC